MSFEAHVGGRRVRVDGRVDDAQFIALAEASRRIFAEPENLRETLALKGIAASDWTGDLHLHLGGKTGETIFAASIYPAIRAVVPQARIVLHVHPAFARVAGSTSPAPDDIVSDDWWTEHDGPVADQVSAGLKTVARFMQNGAWRWDDGELHTCLYRTWQGQEPFYRLFMQAAGVTGKIAYPRWLTFPGREPTICLVFASGNKHTGGAREIDLSPLRWSDLADLVIGQGFSPMTTVAAGDRRPSMPGWNFVETDRPEDIIDMLPFTRRVVGLNSGIVFAATLFSPGTVTMLDTQTPERRPAYAFGPMVEDGMMDKRHVQIPWEVAEKNLFKTVREALL